MVQIKSKRKDYRSISDKNKKKPAKSASPDVEKRPIPVSVQHVVQCPPARVSVSSISSIYCKDGESEGDGNTRKWKISQLVESQS